MKRFCVLLLAFCLLFTVSACQIGSEEEKPSISIADPTEPTPTRVYDAEESTEESSDPAPETQNPIAALCVPGNSYAQVYRTETGAIWAMVIMEYINVSDKPLHFDYADIDLLDENGDVFQTIETVAFAPQVLAPGESGYYCEVVPLDVSEEISLTPKLSPNFSGIRPSENEAVGYDVTRSALSDSLYGGLELQVTVKNNSQVKGELVCVAAILKNDGEEPVGFITGFLDSSLAAGKSAEVTFESFMLPPGLTAEAVAGMEVFAFPLLEQS